MSNHKPYENFSTPTKHEPRTTSPISKVRVIVRTRNFLPLENQTNPSSCISCTNSSDFSDVTVLLKDNQTSRNECYKLDAYFGQDDDDNNVSQIFEREVKPLIPGVFRGYNATVFAYGATGSGKTYTMQGSDKLPGLMPFAMSSVLSMCECTGSSVAISYYEIYLDKCYDLLEQKDKEVLVWDDKDGQVRLIGLARVEVDSMEKFREVFSLALQRRKVAHTGLNDVSSRSHGVLVITVSTPCRDSVGKFVTGKINLIDLAGNEDNRRTCNEGIRLQESAKINQSLFALSNVIYALNNGKPRIPYRESKLTRVLQDSLGGTSRALMVACLNQGEYQESVHTVSLAARSRHVSNFPYSANKNANSSVKVDMEAKLLSWMESKGKTKSSQRMGPCHSPFPGRTPTSVKPTRKLNTYMRSTESKASRDQVTSNVKQRSSCTAGRNLFHGRGFVDQQQEAHGLAAAAVAEISKEKSTLIASGEEETIMDKTVDVISLTPINEKLKALMTPQRNALSPIDTNLGNSVISMPSDEDKYNFQVLGTPLDKITARSSSLKSSLVQDYIEFLNTASREELLELKGIGQKIADYVVELRETSPLKSLCDLEKLGLSSKQVHNMFGMAARGLLLEKVIDNV